MNNLNSTKTISFTNNYMVMITIPGAIFGVVARRSVKPTSLSVCMCAFACVSLYKSMCLYLYMCVVYVFICVHICTCVGFLFIQVCVCICELCIVFFVCMCVCACIFVYVYRSGAGSEDFITPMQCDTQIHIWSSSHLTS